ncbi:MAG: HemK/PrmC family methyltransferase [Planctomycetota bacterium]|nr:HemK/PrmC family methyltransferase [Planctomycetota bacterium]
MSPEGPWTILKVIEWSTGFLGEKGIESPKTEVEILLAHALEMRRIELYVQFERVLDNSELARFKELLLRRAKREPTAYILGMREFYGIEFDVDGRALIPRPETEHLVDRVVHALKGLDEPMVCDLCTGCGNVAVAVAKTVSSARVVATDFPARLSTLRDRT